jgi:aromatic-amino-acid transaminase
LSPNATVLISDPSWENHRALFTNAGFKVDTYAYYDAATRGVNFEGMLASLNAAAAGTVVVLHACCHNPTGYDITPAQWDQVVSVVKAKNLTAFLDMAYQGFGHGIAEDGAVIQKFVAAGLSFFVSTSFSKSFSLYGERVGALSVLCANKEEADRVLSQLKIVIRTNYSNPPIHGGAVVAAVLGNPELRALWEKELGEMRVRIKAMRQKLVDGLKAAGVKQDMSFITTQIGMFSYSGLNKDQMVRLRNEFGVYGTDTGRMCVAALNSKNIDYVCASIAKVV